MLTQQLLPAFALHASHEVNSQASSEQRLEWERLILQLGSALEDTSDVFSVPHQHAFIPPFLLREEPLGCDYKSFDGLDAIRPSTSGGVERGRCGVEVVTGQETSGEEWPTCHRHELPQVRR